MDARYKKLHPADVEKIIHYATIGVSARLFVMLDGGYLKTYYVKATTQKHKLIECRKNLILYAEEDRLYERVSKLQPQKSNSATPSLFD